MSYTTIDPDEDLDFSQDWSAFLSSSTPADTINTSTWAIEPSGPTLHDPAVSSAITSTFVTGCVRGKVYRLTNEIVTNSTPPRTAHRSITLRCEQL